jgi:hypothetical protein
MAGSKLVRPLGAFPAPVGIVDQLIPAFDHLIVTSDQLIGFPSRCCHLVAIF